MRKGTISTIDRKLNFNTYIPVQFLYLCKLTGVDPHSVLHDFMVNVGMENRSKEEEQKTSAKEYFLKCGYGQEFYSEDEITQIMKELQTVSDIFPNDCPTDFLDVHSAWRELYFDYWFDKWYWKHRRQPYKK